MAVALVQAKSQEFSSALSGTVTPASAVATGNLLLVAVGVFGETTSSVSISDTLGSTWTKVLTTWQPDRDSGIFFNWYYTVLASSGTNGVKVQGPSSSGFWGITVAEFSGVGTPTQDGSGGAAGSETNPQNGATFTAVAGDLLLAFMGDEGNSETLTAGAGWTKAASASAGILNNCLIYVLSATAGSTHGIWGTGQIGSAQGNIYLALTPGGSGTTHTQTLSVTQTTTVNLLKQVGKPLSVAQASTVTVARSRVRIVLLSIAQASTIILTKSVGKTLSVAQTTAVPMIRQVGKALTLALTSTPALSTSRVRTVLLTVVQTAAASMTRQVGKTMSVVQGSVPALSRRVGKVVSVTQATVTTVASTKVKVILLFIAQAGTALLARQIGKGLAVTQTTAPMLSRQIGKALAVSQSTAATLVLVKVKIVILSVAQATTISIVRQVGKALLVGQSSTPQITRQIGKGLRVAQSTSVTLAKSTSKALGVSQSTLPALAPSRVRLVLLSVAQTSIVRMTRQVGKALFIAQSSTPQMTRLIAKSLSVAQSSIVSLLTGGTITVIAVIRRAFIVPARLFHFVVPPRQTHFTVPQRSFHFTVSTTPYALPVTPGDSDNTIGSTENLLSYDIDFGPWLQAGEGVNGCSVTCTAVLRSNPTFDMSANAAAFVINSAISGTKVVGTVDPHNALIGARYTLLFSATTSLGRTLTKPLQPLDCDR